jgi:hypothetical protein
MSDNASHPPRIAAGQMCGGQMNSNYQPRPRMFVVMFMVLAAFLLAAIVLGMSAPTLFSGSDAPTNLALA